MSAARGLRLPLDIRRECGIIPVGSADLNAIEAGIFYFPALCSQPHIEGVVLTGPSFFSTANGKPAAFRSADRKRKAGLFCFQPPPKTSNKKAAGYVRTATF
jgi:hypothetical protein